MQLLERTFRPDGQVTLDLDQIPTKVTIRRSSENSVSVLITGPEKHQNEVSAEHQDDTVVVRGPETYVGNVSVSNGSVSISSISGGNISVINGRVFIDGKEKQSQVHKSSPNEEPLDFVISVPDGSNLVLGSVGVLECETEIDEARFQCTGRSDVTLGRVSIVKGSVSGQSDIDIEAVTGGRFRLRASGQSDINVNGLVDCDLELSVSGQGDARLDGTFTSVEVECSGQADISTNGAVSGDYRAVASGMSEIRHRGGVTGKIRQSSKGMSEVSIR